MRLSLFSGGRSRRVVGLVALLFAVSWRTASASTIFIGSLTDPLGDTFNSNVTPFLGYGDLTSAETAVDSLGSVSFRIRFAPGTVDGVHGFVELDIDTTPADANSPNVDYFVQVTGSAGSSYKRICQVTPTVCGAAPDFLWVTDGVDISFPIAAIQSDGDFAFRVRSFYYVGGNTSTGTLDETWNGTGPWARTAAVPDAVPEPTSLLLLGTGLAAIAVRRWQLCAASANLG